MLNNYTFMGRLTQDPELMHTRTNNVPVANVTLACERDRKDKDGNKKVDFIKIVAWRHTAEFLCKYFKKGQLAVVNGRLEIDPWEDKDGNKRYDARIRVEDIYFGGYNKSDSVPDMQGSDLPPAEDDDELPF